MTHSTQEEKGMSLAHRVLPEQRRAQLRARLAAGQNLRLIEAHSGLSALVGGTAQLATGSDPAIEFDGLWISSLTSSAARGLPDMEMYILERRLELIEEIAAVTGKIIVVDGDTGGDPAMFAYLCARLEAIGVCAVVIEDKQHPKRNSLSLSSTHVLEEPSRFADKIQMTKPLLRSPDFHIFARLESLIAGESVTDALARARTYLLGGADGIMIHSKSRDPESIYQFLRDYRALCAELGMDRPVMCVPTTYNTVTAQSLFDRGARIVVHANHMLRAAHFAMQQVCEQILRHDRTLEVDNVCTPVSDLFRIVGYNDVLAREQQRSTGGASA
jgi:phosphoenolpyruvate phosphomutase